MVVTPGMLEIGDSRASFQETRMFWGPLGG